MKNLFLAMIVLASASAFAENCDNASTTIETRLCLDRKLQKADVQLNKNYKSCMNKLDQTAKSKLLKAQRAWIAFRDAQCEFSADEMRGGTLETVLLLGCNASMTEERAEELKDCVEFR